VETAAAHEKDIDGPTKRIERQPVLHSYHKVSSMCIPTDKDKRYTVLRIRGKMHGRHGRSIRSCVSMKVYSYCLKAWPGRSNCDSVNSDNNDARIN
jgi:hypothetical protein